MPPSHIFHQSFGKVAGRCIIDRRARGLDYAWIVLAATAVIGLVVGGLGRFGYTLILPSMRDDLGLSYTQSGFLVTANFAGYLAAAFVGGLVNARLGVRVASVAGLVVMLLGMIGSAFAPAYPVLLILQFPIGFGSGSTLVSSVTTLPAWFPVRLRGLISGAGNGAAGLGIVMSGLFVPPLLAAFGESGWRQTWIAFAIAGGVALVVAAVFLRRHAVSSGPARPTGSRRSTGSVFRVPLYWKIASVMPLMGAVTAVYATYFGAFGTRELRIDPALVGGIWSGVGVLSVLSGIIWGMVSDRAGRKPAAICVFGVQSLASLILVVASAGAAVTLTISGLIAGLTLFGAASVLTAVMVDAAEPDDLPAVGGMMAIGNGIGQLAGPALAGSATDLTGSLAAAYIFAAVISLLATSVVMFLPIARLHQAASRAA